MKVVIDAGGRQVIIETLADSNLTHNKVADKALEVWKQTESAAVSEGPAFGFSQQFGPERDASSSQRGHKGRSARRVE